MEAKVLNWFNESIENGKNEEVGSSACTTIDGITYMCVKTGKQSFSLYEEDGFLPIEVRNV